jgi:hypothetical protein
VRDYFSQFGTITEVEIEVYKRLAIVTFEDHASAQRAYKSPKAVFDNRFVKVFWYREAEFARKAFQGSLDDVEMAETHGYDSRPPLDLEAIAKRQAELQEVFEERQRKKKEADAKAADIERQLKEKDVEMKAIKQQLAELARNDSSYSEEQTGEKLATLDTTLGSLFKAAEFGSDGTSRAVYRSLSFPSRGRGYAPRGAYRGRGRGRGAFRGRGPHIAVKRLDFRPRRLAIAGIEKGSEKDEVLRQYLVVCLTQVVNRQCGLTDHRDFPSAPASSYTPSSQMPSSLPSRSAIKLKW